MGHCLPPWSPRPAVRGPAAAITSLHSGAGESMSDLAIIRSKFESLRTALDERLRRLWAAAEAKGIGRGGVSGVSAATGLSRRTITTGLRELQLLDATAAGTQPDCAAETQPRRWRGRERVRLP